MGLLAVEAMVLFTLQLHKTRHIEGTEITSNAIHGFLDSS